MQHEGAQDIDYGITRDEFMMKEGDHLRSDGMFTVEGYE